MLKKDDDKFETSKFAAKPAVEPLNQRNVSDKPITVTFTGDPRGVENQAIADQDPKTTEYEGKEFPKGKAVKIDDDGWIKAHGEKLRTNNHFRVE